MRHDNMHSKRRLWLFTLLFYLAPMAGLALALNGLGRHFFIMLATALVGSLVLSLLSIRVLARRDAQAEKRIAALNRTLIEAQERIMHASKLSALGELTASIAHEIKQPLTTIRLVASTLEVGAREPASGLDLDDIQEINKQVDRIVFMVDSLRVATHVPEVTKAPTAVNEMIEHVARLFDEQFRQLGAGFTLEVAPDLPRVTVNRAEFEQVLANLLSNACDAIKHTAVRQISLRVRRVGEELEFAVEDSGAGVPQEIRKRLFYPFFTTKPDAQGSGLGLAISRRIADKYGGTLELDASYNQGARFVVRLPLETCPP